MFVDTGMLRSGAHLCHRASDHAQDGAAQLARGPLFSGMFGQFGAAETFHEALVAAHAEHVRSAQNHHEVLTTLGGKAHHTSAEFTNMEERNATQLRMTRCSFAT
ncbi:MAG: DUF2563 family protein [Mycobacteriaceae bacterium]|nr:DUF2563 family protein [Mycobacteriaceae bacterium]